MAYFQINRGIGRSVEFQGLKAHYLFIFAGGLVGAFFLSVALHLMGFSQMLCNPSVTYILRQSV